MEDALCRSKWIVGVNRNVAWLRRIWPRSLGGGYCLILIIGVYIFLSVYIYICRYS